MTWCIQKIADTESDNTLSVKHNGTRPLPSHHSDLLKSINRCIHLFTFAKLMCKKVASHCGLIYTNVHIYGTIFFFLSFFGGVAFIFLYKFLFRFCFRLFYCPPQKTLRQNKQTNSWLWRKVCNWMLDLGVKSQQHKQRPNKEIKKYAGTSPPCWPESQKNPAGVQDTGSCWLDREK